MIFGREHELQTLTAAYEQMLAGRGSVLFLTGEAGLGKTTLVHSWKSGTLENAQRDEGRGLRDEDSGMRNEGRGLRDEEKSLPSSLSPHPSSLFLESACSIPIGNVDVGRLEALQPWADVIAQAQEKIDQTDRTDRTDQTNHSGKKKLDFKKLIHEAAPAWAWAIPFVGDIAHAALETSRLVKEQRGDFDAPQAAQNQQQVFQQYVNLLTKVSEETPLVIFLDDLHWADTSSCNLLFYLSRQIADKKILVICTYRQDDAAQASDGKGHAIVTIKNEILRYKTGAEYKLSYLTIDAITAILARSFPSFPSIASLPDTQRFLAWLLKISDGNSLFVTQFIETLREDGQFDNDGRFIGDYDAVKIPESALAVVVERTRRMDDGLKKLLTYATAEGEEFTSYVLERLMRKDAMDFLDDLQRAIEMGLIIDKGTSRAFANTTTEVFGFSHALFHKALYDQLIEGHRRRLHRSCFELLKQEWDRRTPAHERTTTLATKLITHAEKCEEWETVAEVALDAAREFWKSYAEGETLEMVETCARAAERTGNVLMRAHALALGAEVHLVRSRFDRAFDLNGEARALYAAAQSELEVLVMQRQAYVRHRQHRNAEARELALAGLALSEQRGDVLGQAACKTALAHASSGLRFPDEALRWYKEAEALYQQGGDQLGVLRSVLNIGLALGNVMRYDEALEYHRRALEMAIARGDRNMQAAIHVNMSQTLFALARSAEAIPLLEQASVMFHDIGNDDWEANALGGLCTAYLLLGNATRAVEYAERELAIRSTLGNSVSTMGSELNLLSAYRSARNVEKAHEHLAIVDPLVAEYGDAAAKAYVTCELALVAELTAESLPVAEQETVRRGVIAQLEDGIAQLEAALEPLNVQYYTNRLMEVKARQRP